MGWVVDTAKDGTVGEGREREAEECACTSRSEYRVSEDVFE